MTATALKNYTNGGTDMSFAKIMRKRQLETLIKDYSQKYYTDGSSPVSDEEFDALVDELRMLSSNSKEITSVGWGYETSKDTTPGQKVEHKYGLVGSLPKIHSFDELLKEYKSEDMYDASLKLDGLSVVLYYVDSKLERAVTRGDGYSGIDITDKVRYITDMFNQLRLMNFTGAIRGEILMSKIAWESFKEDNPDAKNSRNATAGLINRKDIAKDLKLLTIIPYTIVGCETMKFNNYEQILAFLEECFGFSNIVPNSVRIKNRGYNFIGMMNTFKNNWYVNYPADGIVVNFGIEQNGSEISYRSMAYKFKTESIETEVESIEWEMSKTRYAIPRVRIKPVIIDGTKIEYAAGHNAENIKARGLGKGAVVKVTKANEIIPFITDVIKPVEPALIKYCPICGSELVWSGVHLCCANQDCGNARTQDLLVWINNIAPLDNFGDTLRLKYIHQYFGNDCTISTLMSNSDRLDEDDIWSLESTVQGQLFIKFLDLIHHAPIPAENAIKALNIPRLGDVTSAKLAKNKQLICELINASCGRASTEMLKSKFIDLYQVVGNANANSIIENIDKFRRLIFVENRIVYSIPSEHRGKVAITGRLSVPRAQLEKEIKAAGFEISDVKKDTKYLIIDDLASTSSKNKNAIRFGITRLSEAEFRSKFLTQ